MIPTDEKVRQIAYLLRGGSETMHRLAGAAALSRADWLQLDASLTAPQRQLEGDDPFVPDARLLLWLEGVSPTDLAELPARQRLLGRVLSCGLRTSAFELVLDQCTRLGFAEPFGAVDSRDPSNEIDLRMKHVRLLKRRGAYGEALQVLGTIAVSLKPESGAETELSVAALLYSVAKSLGSHQNRNAQSRLLCTAVAGRIVAAMRRTGVERRDFLGRSRAGIASSIAPRAEQLWAKVTDYEARLQLPVDADDESVNLSRRRALLQRWDAAIAFEDRHGIHAGRSRFARNAALFTLAQSAEDRLLALRAFEKLLLALMNEVVADQRGVAIRALQAAQMCAEMQAWGKAHEYAELSLDKAATAADWHVMARALLLKSRLVIAARQNSPESGGESLYLAQRARDAMERLREPPLQLLFDHCVGEARIALSMANHTLALQRIGQAIEHIARMRDALLQEDWIGSRPGSPAWLRAVTRLLTPRQRTMMQTLLVTDWQRLLKAQDALVELMGSAHELENYLGNVAISAAREQMMRSGLAHDVANVVSKHMSSLIVDRTIKQRGNMVVPATDVALVQQRIEDEIRRYVVGSGDASTDARATPGSFAPASRLVAIDARQLELLRTFVPELPEPTVQVHNDFELRCDERLFNILFFQLLLNASQELVGTSTPQIDIVVSWSSSQGKGMGLIEVSDSAGRVEQLRTAIMQVQGTGTVAGSRRGWGMREALRFFSEALRCKAPEVSGTEGHSSTLQLRFPHGRTVNRGAQPDQANRP